MSCEIRTALFTKKDPRTFFSEIKMELWKVSCANISRILLIISMKIATPPLATTGSQQQLWKERRKLHKIIRQEILREIRRAIISQINCPKLKLWNEILNVPTVMLVTITAILTLVISTKQKKAWNNFVPKLPPTLVLNTLAPNSQSLSSKRLVFRALWHDVWRIFCENDCSHFPLKTPRLFSGYFLEYSLK